MYAKDIKDKAKERAKQRRREGIPNWTVKYDELTPKAGEKITESDNVLYRQEIRRCLGI